MTLWEIEFDTSSHKYQSDNIADMSCVASNVNRYNAT